MSPVTNSSSESPAQPAKPTLPSCNLCRQRKIKCDRVDPCSHCQRSGSKCVFSAPSRLPRGRQGGRRKADSELLQRISKLETLVKSLEADGSSPASKSDSHTPSSSDVGMAQQRKLPTPDSTTSMSRKSSKDDATSKLDQPFLRTISDEITGLRYVLGSGLSDDEDDEADFEDPEPDGNDKELSAHSRFAILGPGWVAEQAGVHQHPSLEQVYILCEVYMTNVQPVSKILHGPSLRAYLHRKTATLNCSPGPKGLEALHYAVFHAAVVSLDDIECKTKLGVERHILLRRYRLGTELALAKADFVNTTEMSTLQALVLFLQTVRAYDKTRFSWTLVSLCVRIGQALGLHRESNHSSLPLFQREMRRRLWWQIAVIDSSLTGDRGTDPVIGPGSYDTRQPLHINEDDIWLGGPEEVEERESFTDLTFCSIVYDIFETYRVLNLVQPGDSGPIESQAQRIAQVTAAQARLEKRYLRHLDTTVPFQWYAKMVADCIRACFWLIVYRPLQQRPGFHSEMQHPNILHLSLEIMDKGQLMLGHPVVKPFNWLAASYVPWHAVAITLAELCVQTEGPLVERAWAVIDQQYNAVEKNIAGGSRGTLFRPIRRLMAKAKKVRQTHLEEVASGGNNNLLDFNRMEITPTHTSDGMSSGPSMDFNSISTEALAGIDANSAWLTSPEITRVPAFDWGNWLSMSGETAGLQPTAWNNWEHFMNDFQFAGENTMGQDFGFYNFGSPQ